MKKTFATLFATGLTAAMLTLTGGSASAAHCADNGGPGNSDLAAHVKASNGPGGHTEGDHQGWSSCEPQAKGGGR
ncbi:MAG: hypothetical protein ACR2FE_09475 [Aeromicrobium sp.]